MGLADLRAKELRPATARGETHCFRFWLALYGAKYIRLLKSLIRCGASAQGGGRTRAVLVARPNGSAWQTSVPPQIRAPKKYSNLPPTKKNAGAFREKYADVSSPLDRWLGAYPPNGDS